MKLQCSILFVFLIVSLVMGFYVVEAEEPSYFIYLTMSHDYVVRGEIINVTTTTNYTGYLLQIFLPKKELWHNQTYPANTTKSFLIPDNAPYGTYTVKALIPNSTVTSWFTVLDILEWSNVDFPHNIIHQGIDYTFYSNWTFQATGSDGTFTIDLSMLRQLADNYNLITIPRKNSMNFRVRFTNYAAVKVDLMFAFIHKGCKLIINGSIDQPRQFTFNITNYRGTFKKILSGIKTGHLVFDWSDIPKQAFTYSNGLLTVNIPENFRVDPYIFEDGFESGYTPWTGTSTGGAGTIAINQTIIHHGVNSSRADTSGGGADYAFAYETFTAQSDAFARAYVHYDAGTNTYNEFADFIQLKDQADGNPYVAIGIKVANGSDWNLHLRYYNGSLYDVDSATKISETAWHSLELHVDCTNGKIDVFLDDANITDLHIEDVDFGANQIDQVQVGLPHFAGAGFWWPVTIYADCVVVDDAYIGVEAVGATYYAWPDINITFSISSMRTFHLTLNPSIALKFITGTTILFYDYTKINPTIILDFALSTMLDAAEIFNRYSSIVLTFSLSSTTSFIQHVFFQYSSIVLTFSLSSLTSLIQHLFFTWSRVNLVFQIGSFSSLVLPTEYATKGFVLSAILLGVFIFIPIIGFLVLRRR